MDKPKAQLIFMMKAPRPGTVKTRLAADIGEENATLLYRRFVEFLCGRLFSEARACWDTVIAFAPSDSEVEIRDWLSLHLPPNVQFRPQCAGDLGARLEDQFESAFQTGAPAVLALGTDCLDLTPEEIAACFEDLRQRNVVMGEARDGGYWCIGMSGRHFQLFREMPWSQQGLSESTRAKALELGLTIAERAKRTDIDQREDLESLSPEIRRAAKLDETLWQGPGNSPVPPPLRES